MLSWYPNRTFINHLYRFIFLDQEEYLCHCLIYLAICPITLTIAMYLVAPFQLLRDRNGKSTSLDIFLILSSLQIPVPLSSHVFPSDFKISPGGHAHWFPAGDNRQKWLHPPLLWQAVLPKNIRGTFEQSESRRKPGQLCCHVRKESLPV